MLRFNFDRDVLKSVAGGRSALDMPRLNIHTYEAALAFIKSYGFDLQQSESEKKLWYYHRRSIVFLMEKLGFAENEIPELLRDQKNMKDITLLLLLASSQNPAEKNLQKWACAILRCMHVFVHNENDLFHSFSEEIQSQILTPFQQAIIHDGSSHSIFLKTQSMIGNPVELVDFEIKPFKTSASSVIKLLARPEALAMKIFDKLGVRFITKSVFDSFQVIRFLVEENIISFPHIMPDQSSNNLFPVDLFLEICEELKAEGIAVSDEFLKEKLWKSLQSDSSKSDLFRKPNEHSANDFQFIKFISRRLIEIKPEGYEKFSFFYPFEVQIIDQVSFQKASTGPSEHEAYKERQKGAARLRLFPEEKN